MAKPLDLAAAGSGSLCTLPYPERYEASSRFAALAAEDGATLSQETQLMLYALKQQVVEGPASASSKASGWGWSVVENAKYSAWKQLGNMSAMEAMRLYVRTVEEEHPNWYTALLAHETANPQPSSPTPAYATAAHLTATPAAAEGAPEAAAPLAAVGSHAVEGAWTPVTTQTSSGKRPCPRYEHGAAIMDGFLYVVGGNYAGRYLGDVWRLDLSNSTWSQVSTAPPTSSGPHTEANGNGAAPEAEVKPPAPVLGPLAGHTVAQWGDNLLLIGGHVKAKTAADAGAVLVRALDPSSGAIKVLEPAGTTPCARGGHSATRIGDQLWVFGGEDATRKPLDDLHCLDMGGMVWSQPLVKRTDGSAASKAWPGPRSAHSAAAFLDRYIVIFGGGSAATCYSDLFVLDTKAEEGPAWIKITQRAKGQKVTPRAGHSAVVCGDVMYIVGGGNNVKGCTDVLGLDLSGLSTLSPDQPCTLTWHNLTSTPARDPLSSEGISLLVLQQQQQPPVLVAFGGYNGKYHNAVSVMPPPKLPPSEEVPESGVEGEGAQLEGKPSQRASVSGPTENGESTPAVAVPPPPPLTEVELLRQQVAELQAALAVAREEAETAVRGAAAAAAADTHELALLRKQLATTQSALDTASKGLEDARAALGRESSKVMRLEVEGAELLKMLNAAGEERKELEALRRQVKEAESKKGGSIWGYIAGGTPA